MDLGAFVVARVNRTKALRLVAVDGEEVMADVSMLEVELTAPDGQHGSLTLRFYSTADIAAAQAEYVEGATTALASTTAPVEPAAAEPVAA